MNDDPQEISNDLITKHGNLKAAFEVALEGAAEALDKEDLYALSVWRDVKRILRAQIED